MSSSSAVLIPVTVTTTLSFTRTPPLPLPLLKPHFPSYKFKSLVCHCSISDREEQRWLREEQRWLREEQRWLREEHRWVREREELLREISELKLQIQALEHRILSSSSTSSVSDVVANATSLLQVLKDKNLVLESGSSQRRLVLEEAEEEKEKDIEEVVEHEKEVVVVEEAATRVKKRSVIRIGSEGEDVRQMQEALLKLGFYSGEEDMEFSSFSSGTERAVKTWQSSLGAPEDGIMTSELLERLFSEIRKDVGNGNENKKSTTVLPKEGENGAAVASVTEISEVQQKTLGKSGKGTEVSRPRVFLLGENRWEEPSKLSAKDAVDRSKNKDGTIKCLQCRGEGRLLCTECDGTGEPNIEPQFMEWVNEGTQCPYCEGQGYTTCDLCEGKTVVSV